MKLSVVFVLSAALIFCVAGCGKKSEPDTTAEVTDEVEATAPGSGEPNIGTLYTPVSGDTVTTESGLRYIDVKEGSGLSPEAGELVTVHYSGWLEDGERFDSSVLRGSPFSFEIGRGRVIKGWDEGVSTMKLGGVRRLIIPGNLAYGERGVPGRIPANATLIFDVELISIKPSPMP